MKNRQILLNLLSQFPDRPGVVAFCNAKLVAPLDFEPSDVQRVVTPAVRGMHFWGLRACSRGHMNNTNRNGNILAWSPVASCRGGK